MMQNILLVATREFRQILSLRSFWLTLLILPAMLALTPFLVDYLDQDEPGKVVLIDRSDTGVGEAITQRFADEDIQSTLRDLSQYVERHGLQAADPKAPWAKSDRWYTPADIAQFRASGGVEAAVKKIERIKDPATPEFEAEPANYEFIEAPDSLKDKRGEDFAKAARAILDSDERGEDKPELIVLLDENYRDQPVISLFSANQPRTSFVESLQQVTTADLRTRLLESRGLSQQEALAAQSAAPSIAVATPPPGGGARETMVLRSAIPLALSYALMMSLIISASWMLQGSVEERSNKLLESLLACIRPEELMYGKLLGSLTVGLLMIAVWAACAGFAAFASQGVIGDLIRPALEPISSPGAIFAILFFFLAGYVAVSILFVAIGSMVDSMSEAQGYMMPILFAIMLPITFLLQSIVAGKDGLIVQVLTWFPLWTPFAVLARLGLGIEVWEMIGAGLLLALAIALELVLVARLFRANLLATGQKPTLKRIWERMRTAG